MKPLILLLTVFSIGALIRKLSGKENASIRWMAKLAMGCMLIFTGISHFVFVDGMAAMLPSWFPFKMAIVYLTGILEILGAIGLLMKRYSRITAIGLILFLLLVLPANIYAAIHQINPLTGAADGHGPSYLFFRIPLQLFFIGWIYFSSLKPNTIKYHTVNTK